MKTKLIEAIRETIIDLETGRRNYNWIDASSCNCGLLARNLGVEKSDCYDVLTFRRGAECARTGMKIYTAITALKQAGMSYSDISELEILGNRQILKEAGLPTEDCRYHKKENVLAYFRAWLRILEREQAPQEIEYTLEGKKLIETPSTEEMQDATYSAFDFKGIDAALIPEIKTGIIKFMGNISKIYSN